MGIVKVNFPEKGPMRGQYKFCIAKNLVCSILQLLILKTVAVLLEMLVLINL